MKTTRISRLMMALAISAFGAGAAGANELSNANLDTVAIGPQNGNTPVGWMVDASKTISGANFDGCSSEPWCNVLEQPVGYGLFFKPFGGDAAVGDLLTVHFYQDNPSTPGAKYTLSGYAAAEGNYCGYFTTNSPAPATLFVIQFLDGSSTVLASNAFDLIAAGLPNSGPASMASFYYTTPQVTAPAGTTTVRAGVSMVNAYNTTGAQSFFVDAFDLNAEAPPGSPVITNQPSHQTVSAGATAIFTVGVSNLTGATYQWQLYGTNLVNGGKISGATTATLTITGVSTNDVGHYRVRVTNGAAPVVSSEAALAITGINFYPVVTIYGKLGDTYRVDYSTAVAPTTWLPLSTNLLTTSPQLVLDASSPGNNTRFYRAIFLY